MYCLANFSIHSLVCSNKICRSFTLITHHPYGSYPLSMTSNTQYNDDLHVLFFVEFVVEILLLSGILPCDVYFLDTIYSDAYYVSVQRLVLLVLPSMALLYFGTSRASTVLAVTAVVGAVLSYRPVVS